MKKSRVLRNRWKAIVGAFVLTAMLTAGLAADAFAITSYAASAGKVVANSAKIRKDASTSSESVGSAAKGTAITITGQTTGSDGNTWYQVTVDANTTGYIRSDLVEITDGSTPGTVVAATTTTTTTSSTPTTSTPDENIVEVTAVEPVSANVSGTSPVRVRQNASTTSRIVSTAQGGLALTVNGTANGTDGNEWYQVTFISNGSEVNGFIRASYVKLNGELVPAGSAEAEQPQESTETQPQETTETATTTTKDWETYYQNDIWHLVDNTTGKSYDIAQIFSTVEANNTTLKEVLATNQTQQIAVIGLVILAVVLLSVISVMIFKIKELKDEVYYAEVSKENARKRAASAAQSGQKSAQQSAAGRPAGARPATSGARPAGTRPAGEGGAVKSAGSKPVNGQRPAGAAKSTGGKPVNGQRPAGTRPAGSVQQPAGGAARPVKRQPVEDEPIQTMQEEIFEERRPEKTSERKAKNFVSDEEFEFQYLDWDEEQE